MCNLNDSAVSNTATRLLLKLYESNKTPHKSYNLNDLWELYSDHKPSGPLNGGIQMIDNLTKVYSLIQEGLLIYSTTDVVEPLQSKAFFKDKKGRTLMNFESPLFDSHYVVITEKGIKYVEEHIINK
ncbi:MAG: hypothetical protein MJ162_03115 [Treponema sp.]|nr:hypothetical protein [Treponema sp.]